MDCLPQSPPWDFGLALLLGALAVLSGPVVRVAQAQTDGGRDTLTFDRATRLLLDHNPQLRAARARARTQGKGARAAALFPNPTLEGSGEHTPLPNGGADDEWFLTLTQPLNYPGEQRARRQSADAATRAAEARLQETRTSLYRDLRHRYLAVVTADARRRILHRYTDAVQQAARAATVRYEEGDLSPIRRTRLKSAEATSENDLAEARQQHRTAQRELAAMLRPNQETQSEGLPYAVADSLSFRAVTVDAQAALSVAEAQRDRLQAQRARVERERQALERTRYQRYPDLTLSAGPKQLSTPGGTTLGFTAGLQVELPLWDGGRTAVAAQEGRRSQAEATLDATRRAVEVDVHNALDRLETARGRLQATANTLVRAPDEQLQNALFTYEQGELTLFELLDAIEAARRTELLRVRLTAKYLRALYDLEAAMGVGPADAPIVVEGALSPRAPDL
ncbi:TolC family protein [Salinibacter grassmerensis]|uniref:TolC family protein n=1 Tax=Salinibacter grassmerensis TaxID=3040353 RepID=UPI0021E73E63|nr:TolC family protein [Salinibacter grassmerensis]